MKRSLQVVLGAAGLASASIAASPAMAIDGLTANAAVTTNYVFRGITQSAKRPAVQGGLDYAVPDTGLAVGTWVSSINFGDDTPMEWDVYGNYSFPLGPLTASVGGIGYIYPYAGHGGPYDIFEFDAGLSYDFGFATWSGKAFFSPWVPNGYLTIRNADNPDQEYYLTTGVAVPLAPWISLSGNVSYEGYISPSRDSYVEWDLGATLTYDKYSLDLRYIDTSKHAFKSPVAQFGTGPFFVATFSFKFP